MTLFSHQIVQEKEMHTKTENIIKAQNQVMLKIIKFKTIIGKILIEDVKIISMLIQTE